MPRQHGVQRVVSVGRRCLLLLLAVMLVVGLRLALKVVPDLIVMIVIIVIVVEVKLALLQLFARWWRGLVVREVTINDQCIIAAGWGSGLTGMAAEHEAILRTLQLDVQLAAELLRVRAHPLLPRAEPSPRIQSTQVRRRRRFVQKVGEKIRELAWG